MIMRLSKILSVLFYRVFNVITLTLLCAVLWAYVIYSLLV